MSEANFLSKELGKDNYYIRFGYNFIYGGMSSGKISARVAEATYRYYVSHGTVFKTFVRAYGCFYSRQVLQKILKK